MAYTKQEWVDDDALKGKVTATRMTHIEQGIYDNSLATDKINPSGTATTTAEIEEGQISDVIGFKSLKLKGQTSQYTTTGKNLLAIKQLTTQTINGVTFTPHYTGNKLDYVNVNGTATATAGYFLDNADVDQASTYTNELPSGTYILDDFSGSTSPNAAIFFRYPTGSSTFTTINSVENSRKLTMDSTFKYTSYIRINNGTTVNNMKFYPQLETGSTQTTYEPYTNGASPNPDFPQDVNNVSGDNVIGISNKNLIEYSFKGYNINSQGKFETGGSSLDFDVHIAKVKAGTTYTTTPATNVIAYFDEKPTITSQAYNNSREVITSTNRLTPIRSGYIAMRTATSNTAQVEKGTSATSFVAHQGNDFEINLSTNVVYSPRIWQNTSTVATQANRLFSTPQKLVKAGTYKLATTLDFTTYKYALEVGTTPYPFASTLHDSGWKTTNNFTHTIPKGFVGIIVTRLDNANITADEIKGVKFELRDTTLDDYDIELCKIGTYQDYIYKKDGKWYKHKEVGKVVWNGTESWVANPGMATTYVINRPTDLAQANNNVLYNYFSTVADLSVATEGARIGVSINLKNPNTADLASFKTWLGTNNVEMYYQSTTPTDEEITYAPLLRQLDEVYNSGLYDNTNISQDNSSEAFILDLEACKNNINGIVEYIRR